MAIRRAKSLPPTLKTIVQRFVPLPAVGTISAIEIRSTFVFCL